VARDKSKRAAKGPGMTDEVDLFVIGAGSGGVRAARIASGYGARVMIAEEYRVGGTCVIRGCVPKKLLVYASRFAEEFEDAAGYGWTVPEPTFDWSTLIANKDREIARLEAAYTANLQRAKVEIAKSRAVLIDPHTVKLTATGETVRAKHILIATGGAPSLGKEIEGFEHVISSNEVFHLPQLPKRILIQGGGYIAVEFAGVFNGLGSEVTLVYRGDNILRGFDDDVRQHLRTEMEKRPNVKGLGLEAAGVALNPAGGIAVDDYSQTSVPHIHAVGDVTDRIALTPVAIREGHAFADTVFGKKPTRVDHANVPTAVFSEPECGVIGLTEAEACRQLAKVDIYKSTFRPMKATLSGRDTRTMMKLVVDGGTDRVVGAHIVGADAGEMIQLIGIAVKMKATKADFDATMAVHPTAGEELVTLREKTATHIRQAAE
jgi:glutathione reductase (NADPH)